MKKSRFNDSQIMAILKQRKIKQISYQPKSFDWVGYLLQNCTSWGSLAIVCLCRFVSDSIKLFSFNL
jgi:hypothetical protein